MLARIGLTVTIACLVCICVGPLSAQPIDKKPQKPPAIPKSKPLQIEPDDDELQKLLKASYNERLTLTQLHYYYALVEGDRRSNIDLLLNSAQSLLQAGLEAHQSPMKRLEFLNELAEIPAKMEKHILLQTKQDQEFLRPKARAFRLEVEIARLKAKKAAERPK